MRYFFSIAGAQRLHVLFDVDGEAAGMTMSPAFWVLCRPPTHLHSIIVLVSAGTPAGPLRCFCRHLHGVGRIEIAADFGV